MVHRQRICIEISRDGPVFIDSGGRVIKVPPRIEVTETLGREDIDDETCLPQWGGEPGSMRYVADRYLEHADLPALV